VHPWLVTSTANWIVHCEANHFATAATTSHSSISSDEMSSDEVGLDESCERCFMHCLTDDIRSYTVDSDAATAVYSLAAFPAADTNNSSLVHSCTEIRVKHIRIIIESDVFVVFSCKT